MTVIRRLDAAAISAVNAETRTCSRGRATLNFHPTLDDPYQRFMNVLQPGSYVRPHRHDQGRFELFLLLEGRAAAIVFDDHGAVVDQALLARGGIRAVEIPGGRWHTLLALSEDTVLFEVKPGPYVPLEDKDFAPWSPREGDADAAAALARWEETVTTAARG